MQFGKYTLTTYSLNISTFKKIKTKQSENTNRAKLKCETPLKNGFWTE